MKTYQEKVQFGALILAVARLNETVGAVIDGLPTAYVDREEYTAQLREVDRLLRRADGEKCITFEEEEKGND